MKTFPCPKCNRNLGASGVVTIGGKQLPTFQCDECLMKVNFDGEEMELALTFMLDENGQPFDPAAPDGRLRLD
jgi:hypothetical protein